MATLPLPPALQSGPPSSADLRRYQGWLGADRLQAWLAGEHRIEVPIVRWGKEGHRWIRISAQAYNSREQFVHLAEVLQTYERIKAGSGLNVSLADPIVRGGSVGVQQAAGTGGWPGSPGGGLTGR